MMAQGAAAHAGSVAQVVLKALQGEKWCCGKSFMTITLSRCSGQETSECNGSAGSPQYGFMKVQGWRGGSVTCLCFPQTKRHQWIAAQS